MVKKLDFIFCKLKNNRVLYLLQKKGGVDCLKKLIKLIVATLITLTIGVMISSTAQAATVHYVEYDKTAENIIKEIKQGKPTEADFQDGSHAVYIYRKNNTCGVSVPKRGQELPNTGTVANTVYAAFAVVLVAGGLYLVKSNKVRNIAKTVLVLGGLGTFFAFQGEVFAADSSILGQIIEQMNLDPEEIDCYDYVGFYISKETTTAEPTTVVTTESTTETTTEEPTTTTEATTTTETTTTEEPTTQTEGATSTEAYTVAPTDRL